MVSSAPPLIDTHNETADALCRDELRALRAPERAITRPSPPGSNHPKPATPRPEISFTLLPYPSSPRVTDSTGLPRPQRLRRAPPLPCTSPPSMRPRRLPAPPAQPRASSNTAPRHHGSPIHELLHHRHVSSPIHERASDRGVCLGVRSPFDRVFACRALPGARQPFAMGCQSGFDQRDPPLSAGLGSGRPPCRGELGRPAEAHVQRRAPCGSPRFRESLAQCRRRGALFEQSAEADSADQPQPPWADPAQVGFARPAKHRPPPPQRSSAEQSTSTLDGQTTSSGAASTIAT